MITLDEIIEGYMLQNELPEGQQYRIEQLAIRGYRQLHYHAIGLPKQVELDILANNTAELPCDFLTKLRLGPINSKGEIVELNQDDIMSTTHAKPNAQLGQELVPMDMWFNYDYPYPFIQTQLGVGSMPSKASYVIDYKCNIVKFDPNCNLSGIQLKYLPMVNEAEDYVVHPFFQEALICWLKWQDSVGRPKLANEREMNKIDYDNALRNAKRAMKPFNVGDMYNQYRQSVRLAIKA